MTSSKKIVLPIRGLHCRSCEILLEDALKRVPHVERVSVNYRRGTAEIFYAGKIPDAAKLEHAVQAAGYKLGASAKGTWFAQDSRTYRDLGIALLVFLGLYFLFQRLGLTDLDFFSERTVTSLPIVLLVGLVAGVSSCMALVGGLTLGFAARYAECHADATPAEKFRPHLFFNLGRVVGYGIFGALLGLLGSVFQFSSFTLGIVTLLAAGVMFYLGLQLTDLSPRLSACKFTLPKSLTRGSGKNSAQTYTHAQAFLGGAFTFFLPCGFTQAMQVLAIATGNFVLGGLVMLTFALGTAPGLLALGGLAALARGAFARFFFRFAGVTVIFFALLNLTSGLTLVGVELPDSVSSDSAPIISESSVNTEGVQIIRMEENSFGYSPNRFTLKKDVPVRWIIDAKNIYSCASALVVPALGIQKNLVAGENVLEFTPREIGTIGFSCSMGMYRGTIEVVD